MWRLYITTILLAFYDTCYRYIILKEWREQMNNNEKLTPLRAIKKHCFECSGYEKKQVRECMIKECVLFPFRQGSNPNRKGCTIKKSYQLLAISS